jgi:hypothetical protein
MPYTVELISVSLDWRGGFLGVSVNARDIANGSHTEHFKSSVFASEN